MFFSQDRRPFFQAFHVSDGWHIFCFAFLLFCLLPTILPAQRLPGAPPVVVTLTSRAQMAEINTDVSLENTKFRQLMSTSGPEVQQINTTDEKRSTGQLTFYNTTGHPILINAGIVTGTSGIPIAFDGPLYLQNDPPMLTVLAVAANAGAAGNIPAFDIVKPCCAKGVYVKNIDAFTGGSAARQNSTVQQRDVDSAVTALGGLLTPPALTDLNKQIRSTEGVAQQQDCRPNVKVSYDTFTPTVQVSVSCTAIVFDNKAVNDRLLNDLSDAVFQKYFAEVGSVLEWGPLTFQVVDATISSDGYLKLQVQAHAFWIDLFEQAFLRAIPRQIAGMSQGLARSYLLRQPGVLKVQFSRSGDLPGKAENIQVAVVDQEDKL